MDGQTTISEPLIRHDYAQVGEVRLHYAECGSGDKQLVLLLHGFPEFWYSWRAQLIALGTNYHVVAPDMRGYNLSDKPAGVAAYHLDRLMDDVLGLIRHFGAREAAIVGHDWGALVAWAVAERYPQHVSKLAALQVPPASVWRKNLTWQQVLRSWYFLFFQLPRVPEWWISANDFAALERMFKRTARRGTFTNVDLALFKNALRQTNNSAGEGAEVTALTAAINYYRANLRGLSLPQSEREGADARSGAARVRVPTLFIYGERDFAIAPETVRGVRDHVHAPYRELRLANSGHWVQQESAAEVNAALRSFLAE